MKLSVRLCVGGAALLVTLCWAWLGQWLVGVAGGGIVLGWGLWSVPHQKWKATVWLTGCIVAIAWSAALDTAWWLVLPAVGLSLAGWDFIRLRNRLLDEGKVKHRDLIFMSHLRLLVVVLGLGLGTGAISAILQVGLRLEWAIALGLVFAFSLGGVLRGIKQHNWG